MALLSNENNKQKWLKQIYEDYPMLKGDALKAHFVEQMIDAYIADEKKFKAMTYEMKKKGVEFKQQTLSEDNLPFITRIEAEAKAEPSTVTVEDVTDNS